MGSRLRIRMNSWHIDLLHPFPEPNYDFFMVSPSITISTAIDIVYYLHISNSSVAVGNYVLFVPSVDILFGVFFLPPVNYFNLLLYKKELQWMWDLFLVSTPFVPWERETHTHSNIWPQRKTVVKMVLEKNEEEEFVLDHRKRARLQVKCAQYQVGDEDWEIEYTFITTGN